MIFAGHSALPAAADRTSLTMASSATPSSPAAGGKGPCRYGSTCHTAGCAYTHPDAAGSGDAGSGSGAASPVGRKAACKWGASCRNKDKCAYTHNLTVCRYSDKCRTKNCPFVHPNSGNDGTCKTSGCGRTCNKLEGKEYKTCCLSCAYLHKEHGYHGHSIDCDIRDNDGMSPPFYWSAPRSKAGSGDKDGGSDYHSEHGGDYVRQMGEKLIKDTIPSATVTKCERVEDSKLWAKFATKRAELRRRAEESGPFEADPPRTTDLLEFSAQKTIDLSVNEFWLFHGTSDDAAHGIAQSNFRLPTNGSAHGALFGPGAYFAGCANKAASYSKTSDSTDADKAGCKVMMLCRVLLGNQYNIIKLKGNGPDTEADKHCEDPNYDSVVGCVGDSVSVIGGVNDAKEFLVYDVSQIYPEYIMYFK